MDIKLSNDARVYLAGDPFEGTIENPTEGEFVPPRVAIVDPKTKAEDAFKDDSKASQWCKTGWEVPGSAINPDGSPVPFSCDTKDLKPGIYRVVTKQGERLGESEPVKIQKSRDVPVDLEVQVDSTRVNLGADITGTIDNQTTWDNTGIEAKLISRDSGSVTVSAQCEVTENFLDLLIFKVGLPSTLTCPTDSIKRPGTYVVQASKGELVGESVNIELVEAPTYAPQINIAGPVLPGNDATITGQGFFANADIIVDPGFVQLSGQKLATKTDEFGRFQATINVPYYTEAGTYNVTATTKNGKQEASTELYVVNSAGSLSLSNQVGEQGKFATKVSGQGFPQGEYEAMLAIADGSGQVVDVPKENYPVIDGAIDATDLPIPAGLEPGLYQVQAFIGPKDKELNIPSAAAWFAILPAEVKEEPKPEEPGPKPTENPLPTPSPTATDGPGPGDGGPGDGTDPVPPVPPVNPGPSDPPAPSQSPSPTPTPTLDHNVDGADDNGQNGQGNQGGQNTSKSILEQANQIRSLDSQNPTVEKDEEKVEKDPTPQASKTPEAAGDKLKDLQDKQTPSNATVEGKSSPTATVVADNLWPIIGFSAFAILLGLALGYIIATMIAARRR